MQSVIGKKNKRQFLDVTPSVSEAGDESGNVECTTVYSEYSVYSVTAVSLLFKSNKSLSEEKAIRREIMHLATTNIGACILESIKNGDDNLHI